MTEYAKFKVNLTLLGFYSKGPNGVWCSNNIINVSLYPNGIHIHHTYPSIIPYDKALLELNKVLNKPE